MQINSSGIAKRYAIGGSFATVALIAFFLYRWYELDLLLKTALLTAFCVFFYLGILINILDNSNKILLLVDDHTVIYKRNKFTVNHLQVFEKKNGNRGPSNNLGVSLVGLINNKRYNPVMIVMLNRHEARKVAEVLAEKIGVEILMPEDWPWRNF